MGDDWGEIKNERRRVMAGGRWGLGRQEGMWERKKDGRTSGWWW